MDWLEITLAAQPDRLDGVCAELEEAGVSGLVILDEASVRDFLEKNRKYWDYVDDDVLRQLAGVCAVRFYLEDSAAGRAELDRIRGLVPGEYSVSAVRDEDWENNWKQYYQPIRVGDRLIVVPEWLEVPEEGRIPLRMDPGLIFGTGSHPTTRMCLERLQRLAPRRVLDLGCGSGILGIAALLLGAETAAGVDIDEKAPGVVMANAALNGIFEDRLSVIAGDVIGDEGVRRRLAGSYDLVLANIVADVIIAMAPFVPVWLAPEGTFICSGIIEGRQDETVRALERAGLRVTGHYKSDEWHCFTAVREGDLR